MPLEVCVLASGSEGNAIWVRGTDVSVLVDAGLPPDDLEARLGSVGGSLDDVDCLLVSHLHGDHLNTHVLRRWWQKRGRRSLYVHARHAAGLAERRAFRKLAEAACVHLYDDAGPVALSRRVSMLALPLSHDSDPTFGFRLDDLGPAPSGDAGPEASGVGRVERAAFITDTGRVDDEVIAAVADVDVLGLEFNHDPRMLAESGRPASLIRRITGETGHLSNSKAATVLSEILSASRFGGPGLVYLLHLSRECNRPELARSAATKTLLRHGSPAQLVAARQDRPDELRRVIRFPTQATLFEM
jgi:phosphoribosyl 1,2-cyclic phosphodiesterase